MPVGQTPGRCRRRPRPQAEREGEGAFGWTSGSFRYLAARKVVARRAVTQGHAARRVLPRPRPRGDRGRLAAGSFAEGTQLVRLTAVAAADDLSRADVSGRMAGRLQDGRTALAADA